MLLRTKEMHGIERVLGRNDFEVDKLSKRMGIMVFNDFTTPEKKMRDVDGVEQTVPVYAIKCTAEDGKQITVNATYNHQNKDVLEKAKRESTPLNPIIIDFSDIVVGHYVNGNGGFSQLMQTYRAEAVIARDPKEVEHSMNAGQQGKQQPQPK